MDDVTDLQAQVEAARAKVAAKRRPKKEPGPLAKIQQRNAERPLGYNQTLKNSHGGYAGPTLINKIEKQLDKARKKLERKRVGEGVAEPPLNLEYERILWNQALQQGRIEGLAAALGILRSSSMKHEIVRMMARLEEEDNGTVHSPGNGEQSTGEGERPDPEA